MGSPRHMRKPSGSSSTSISVAEDPVTEMKQESKEAPPPSSMFGGSADDMKAKLRESLLAKEQYDVTKFYKEKGFCQKIARHSLFENTTLSVIAFNALWMWVDTDLNKASMLLQAHPVFQIAEHFFCIYFTFEWVMRFGAFKVKRNGLKDAWFVFDSFMVFMMVGETWVMSIILIAAGGGGSSGGLGNASILRLLRLLRLSRMARMAKLLRSMPELLILIKGMVSAMRSVFFTLLLLLILLYVFSIAFRQLTDGTKAGLLHFPTVLGSMHTLLRDGTFMDSMGTVANDLLNEGGGGVILLLVFYIFVFLAAATVMNMLIGVLCEVVSAVAATEREAITVGIVKDGFLDIINKDNLDEDGDNMISRKEFNVILGHPEAVELLERVGVDTMGLIDLADYIFLDEDLPQGKEKQLSFEDFMLYVLSLRGTNTATVKDIVDLRKFVQDAFRKLEEKLGNRPPRSRNTTHANLPAALPREPATPDSSPAPLWPAHRSSSSHAWLDSNSVSREDSGLSRGERHWMQAAQIEGVLAAAGSDLHRFIESVPFDRFEKYDASTPADGAASLMMRALPDVGFQDCSRVGSARGLTVGLNRSNSGLKIGLSRSNSGVKDGDAMSPLPPSVVIGKPDHDEGDSWNAGASTTASSTSEYHRLRNVALATNSSAGTRPSSIAPESDAAQDDCNHRNFWMQELIQFFTSRGLGKYAERLIEVTDAESVDDLGMLEDSMVEEVIREAGLKLLSAQKFRRIAAELRSSRPMSGQRQHWPTVTEDRLVQFGCQGAPPQPVGLRERLEILSQVMTSTATELKDAREKLF